MNNAVPIVLLSTVMLLYQTQLRSQRNPSNSIHLHHQISSKYGAIIVRRWVNIKVNAFLSSDPMEAASDAGKNDMITAVPQIEENINAS